MLYRYPNHVKRKKKQGVEEELLAKYLDSSAKAFVKDSKNVPVSKIKIKEAKPNKIAKDVKFKQIKPLAMNTGKLQRLHRRLASGRYITKKQEGGDTGLRDSQIDYSNWKQVLNNYYNNQLIPYFAQANNTSQWEASKVAEDWMKANYPKEADVLFKKKEITSPTNTIPNNIQNIGNSVLAEGLAYIKKDPTANFENAFDLNYDGSQRSLSKVAGVKNKYGTIALDMLSPELLAGGVFAGKALGKHFLKKGLKKSNVPAEDIVSELRKELAEKGIIESQKTPNLPWKEPIRKGIEPWGYDDARGVSDFIVTGRKTGDVKAAIFGGKNPNYKSKIQYLMEEGEYPAELRKSNNLLIKEGKEPIFTDRMESVFARRPFEATYKDLKEAVNVRDKLRLEYTPSLRVKNRYSTWNMYLGKPQTEHPLYDISKLTKSKDDVIYTIKPEYIDKGPIERQLGHHIRGMENKGLSSTRVGDNDSFFGTMGGFNWKIDKLPNGNYQGIANDVWDLQPFKNKRLATNNVTWSGKLLNKAIKPIQDIEVGKVLGIGKPLNVKVGFILDGDTKQIINTFGLAPAAIAAKKAIQSDNSDNELEKKQEGGNVHEIQKGDTLWALGQKHGVKWEDIAKANNITDPRKLQIGTKVTIPGVKTIPQKTNFREAQVPYVNQPFRRREDSNTYSGGLLPEALVTALRNTDDLKPYTLEPANKPIHGPELPDLSFLSPQSDPKNLPAELASLPKNLSRFNQSSVIRPVLGSSSSYRSGNVSPQELIQFRQQNPDVNTVVLLKGANENKKGNKGIDKKTLEDLGFNVEYLPIGNLKGEAEKRNFNEAVNLINSGNVIVMCEHGYDRTGAVCAQSALDKGYDVNSVINHNFWRDGDNTYPNVSGKGAAYQPYADILNLQKKQVGGEVAPVGKEFVPNTSRDTHHEIIRRIDSMSVQGLSYDTMIKNIDSLLLRVDTQQKNEAYEKYIRALYGKSDENTPHFIDDKQVTKEEYDRAIQNIYQYDPYRTDLKKTEKLQKGGLTPPDYPSMGDILLNRNQNLDFVKRIQNPDLVSPLVNEDGSTSTHRMAAEMDEKGNWFMFPTVVNQGGQLKNIEDNAYNYAMTTGEYIQIPNRDLALWLSANGYKNTNFANNSFKSKKINKHKKYK